MDASLPAENYSDLELSTSRFAAMQAEHSLAVAGFSREIAVIDQGFTHDRDKFITEICIPVERQT